VSSATLDWDLVEVLEANDSAQYEGSERRGQLVRVGGLRHVFEAELLAQTLREQRLWFVIEENQDSAYSNLFVFQRGWGQLVVRRDQVEAVLTVLATIRALPDTPTLDLPFELQESAEDIE
jgi:hypothetical protein